MAFMTTTSRPTLTSFFADLAAGFAERLAYYRTYRATVNEFSPLDDRELSDVGIGRGNIDVIACQAALTRI